jgi:hypothetical protein
MRAYFALSVNQNVHLFEKDIEQRRLAQFIFSHKHKILRNDTIAEYNIEIGGVIRAINIGLRVVYF